MLEEEHWHTDLPELFIKTKKTAANTHTHTQNMSLLNAFAPSAVTLTTAHIKMAPCLVLQRPSLIIPKTHPGLTLPLHHNIKTGQRCHFVGVKSLILYMLLDKLASYSEVINKKIIEK